MRLQRNIFFLFEFFSLLLFFSTSLSGQEASIGNIEPTTCEYLKSALDFALLEKNQSDSSYLILILRPGLSETSKSLSESRSLTIERYLRGRKNGLVRLITGQSKPTGKLGKLEIFVAGERRSEIYFRRNKGGNDSCVE
jgi:hypothetical protein